MDSAHQRMAAAAGSRIVGMVWEDLTPRHILTQENRLAQLPGALHPDRTP